jgi:hypothetical protein
MFVVPILETVMRLGVLRRESPAGLSIGERDAPPEARAGGLPACQPRLQSPGGQLARIPTAHRRAGVGRMMSGLTGT